MAFLPWNRKEKEKSTAIAVREESTPKGELVEAEHHELIERRRNDIEIRRGRSGAIVQVRSREIVIAGEKRKVDPYQLIRIIKRVTQNIGEYKSAEDIYGKIIIGALRKARGDLVNILEDSFGIHWQIDERTGASVFYM